MVSSLICIWSVSVRLALVHMRCLFDNGYLHALSLMVGNKKKQFLYARMILTSVHML